MLAAAVIIKYSASDTLVAHVFKTDWKRYFVLFMHHILRMLLSPVKVFYAHDKGVGQVARVLKGKRSYRLECNNFPSLRIDKELEFVKRG